MGYVEHLLRGKLNLHRSALPRYQRLGQHEDVASCLAVISELEYILELIKDDEMAQKY